MKQHEISIPFCDRCAQENDSIFRHLSHEEIDLLNFEKQFRQFRRGDILYNEGSRISGCYCIHCGIIKVFKTGIDGKEQIIRFAKRGEIIAYRSVLSNELACTSAKAIEDCQVCFIPNDFGLDSHNYLQISLTREELANIVGTATESVIRLLSEFKSDRLLELNGRRIRIINSKDLAKISNEFN